MSNGKQIIQTYRSSAGTELIPFMNNVSSISIYAIQLFDASGKPLLEDRSEPVVPDAERIRHVLADGVARDIGNEGRYPMVGLPFPVDGKSYALFVMLKSNELWKQSNKEVNTELLTVFLIGSSLILAAARFVVKPLLQLRDAAGRMAQGNFDVQLRTNRKDEIGQLNASFNEMAQELAKLDRMRREFVANVSHEIQSPLTSISGFAKALKQKRMSEESRMYYLTIIEEESERMSRISQNLLRLSSLQHDRHPVQSAAFRLDEQLRNVVIALDPQWSGKEISVELDLEPVTVHADEDQLSQVWTNLLGNGIKFTPVRGRIRIRAYAHGRSAVVRITDNGIGIPEDQRTDIFKAFHKADKARDRAVSGSGLGLSIVKQIVDIHEGEIRVDGEPGGGSIFTVKLPLRKGL
ncbi:sensor histidine kinase [Paenibacillus eucommiae]|uniref:histidine kinase n=1 Tax=Paenibacillus eucommiae TaxID=1355755 RepID=A0ABS4J7N8_9BACL|nr:HAMP domain-containing sensor histidine kinase [Paenibacillus eucommiae]MBP1995838.1 signal transduction histidine kinase [Paenibacillus eucommiae]